jgi:mRNA-degrading endonuclease RelE of RelBE toxin-antitoxin system
MHHNYKIVVTSPEYQNALNQLPLQVKQNLEVKLKTLEDDPFLIAKKLRAPLQGKHSVRIDGYRLECRIDLNSHKIFLLSIEPRSGAYKVKK